MERRWISVTLPIVAAIVLDDQVTKAAAAHAGLVAHNPAYALGVVGGPEPMLIAGTILVMVAFLGFVARPAMALGVSPIGPALIVGGMVGNAIDRIRLGGARDFVHTPWAIINLADIAVAAGIVTFVLAVAWRMYRARLVSTAHSLRVGYTNG